MKKLLLPLLLLSGIAFAGCGSNLNQNKLFDNRQKCLNYTNEIQKEVTSRNDNAYFVNSLEQIFYSPKEQKCFIVIDFQATDDTSREEGRSLYEYGNHFSNSTPIDGCAHPEFSNKGCESFDIYIQELKGE